MTDYEVVALTDLAQMVDAVVLQHAYWGEYAESVVPAHMLFTLSKTGGHVLGVYDEGQMIAVLIGLLATRAKLDERINTENLAFYSKRMVVLPEYRGLGIGEQLKWAQFRLACQQGIKQIIWTYDPLLSRNAHLNLRKLGCICDQYLVDYFGSDDSTGLAQGGISDRFQVVWDVESPSVLARCNHNFSASTLDEYLAQKITVINRLEAVHLAHDTSRLLVEIPLDFPTMLIENPSLATEWRIYTRKLFTQTLSKFRVIDFVRGVYDGRECGFYVIDISK